MIFPNFSHEVSSRMAERIADASIPYLFMTGSDTLEFGPVKYTDEILEIMKKNSNFHYHVVKSDSHHFHLVLSEKISEILNDFIEKSREDFAKSHL